MPTLRSVRPALKAGLRPVWRDRETVQIGIDPRRAVALTGMGDAAAVLGLLDGSRDRDQVVTAARAQGVPAPVTERILTLLAAGGVLDDFPAAALAALPQDQRRRLGAELATAALARGYSDAGAALLARREAAQVQIYGPGRIAAALADILTTSGVGLVSTCDDIRLPDFATAHHPGATATGATDHMARLRPMAATEAGDGAVGPCCRTWPSWSATSSPSWPGWLMRAGVAHLAVTAEEAIGIVGPMVRPGQTSCLRCLHLTRSDLDPAWPLILAQLVGRTASLPACDAALAAAVAAQAAVQALAFLDRDPPTRRPRTAPWSWPFPTGSGTAAPGPRTPPAPASAPGELPQAWMSGCPQRVVGSGSWPAGHPHHRSSVLRVPLPGARLPGPSLARAWPAPQSAPPAARAPAAPGSPSRHDDPGSGQPGSCCAVPPECASP